jgi:alkaline phosphatase D
MTQRRGRAVADLLRRRVLQATIALPALGVRGALAAELGYARVMQGPMIGAVTPTSILVWARVSGSHSVEVEYSPSQAFLDTRRTPAVVAHAEDDFTVRIELPGLSPATRYWYRVLLDGQQARYGRVPYAARTAPAGRAPARIAFGSCARVQVDPEQRIFDAVRQAEPDLFVWTGDNIYGDSERPELLAEEYRRQRNVAALEPLLATVPQIATWDDHDFGLNNADRTYSARAGSLRVFRNYWANPASGLHDTPGVFFRYEYAGAELFMLDGRYHRDPNTAPDGPEKTMLGPAQLAWLKAGLRESRAPFKLLVSGSGWSMADGPQGDTWAAFRRERDGLFDFIRDQRIEGVVLLSGDAHIGELNCIRWSERGGYDFYDLVSSPLAQATSISFASQTPEHRVRPVYSGGVNFGLLDFEWEPEPRLHFTLRNGRGEAVWKPLTLAASDLVNGRATCLEKTITA